MRYELGCYGDGAFGHQHTRERCAELLLQVAGAFVARGEAVPQRHWGELYSLVDDLRRAMSDDASEEFAACDWLTEHAPVEGAWWGWQEGDFGLWPVDED